MLNQEECEAIIETVHEQFGVPLTMALGTLTAELARSPERGAIIAQAQADSCPLDVAGRTYLVALAKLAESDSDDPSAFLRTFLPGGKMH